VPSLQPVSRSSLGVSDREDLHDIAYDVKKYDVREASQDFPPVRTVGIPDGVR
jgi:hypothetical protein